MAVSISWGTIKPLLIFFGPWLVPRIVAYVRSIQTAAAQQRRQQQAAAVGGAAGGAEGPTVPRPDRRVGWQTNAVLVVLAVAAVLSLATTFSVGSAPAWLRRQPSVQWLAAPENVFAATASRLQTPVDVLFARLATTRNLTDADEQLRAHMLSLDSRLLYLQYGPDVVAGCPFCGAVSSSGSSDAGDVAGSSSTAYLYYACVGLLAQYMGVLALVTLATAPLVLLGRHSTPATPLASAAVVEYVHSVAVRRVHRWRTPALMLVLLLATADVTLLATYDRRRNVKSTRLQDMDMFYWTTRRWRGAALALLLALLAAVLHAAARGASSGSMLGLLLLGPAPGPTAAQRVNAVASAQGLGRVKGKLNVGAIVRNTILRDGGELRARSQAYWAREVQLVAQAMEEREVLEGVHDALQNRLDMRQIEHDAEVYAQTVIQQPEKTA